MNPVKANTDEKKKMLLLSLVKGSTSKWKQRETMKLFPEDDDPEEKKKAAEETWSSFKQRFQNEWQPVNVVREAQAKIEQIKMTDRADEYISGLGPERIILGLPWLQDHNPDIDWVTEVVHFRLRRKIAIEQLMKPFIGIFDETKELDTGILDKVEDDEVLIQSFIRGKEDSDEVQINAKLSTSQVLAQAHEVKAKLLEELLPPYLSDYSDRFEKKKAERFPPSRPYGHAIDLKPDFKPRDCKIYSLSQKEWIEQDKFLDENL
uniref:Retrotransposon gag domain-containing protein n=1 Tax=Moniliophthora roreri TaxID=221103 RepID=A0A0W0G4V3_MONRR